MKIGRRQQEKSGIFQNEGARYEAFSGSVPLPRPLIDVRAFQNEYALEVPGLEPVFVVYDAFKGDYYVRAGSREHNELSQMLVNMLIAKVDLLQPARAKEAIYAPWYEFADKNVKQLWLYTRQHESVIIRDFKDRAAQMQTNLRAWGDSSHPLLQFSEPFADRELERRRKDIVEVANMIQYVYGVFHLPLDHWDPSNQ